jgi:flavin-dependent dehydrogenase
MAGVAAARELTDKGISVLLLEARDRAGACDSSSSLLAYGATRFAADPTSSAAAVPLLA